MVVRIEIVVTRIVVKHGFVDMGSERTQQTIHVDEIKGEVTTNMVWINVVDEHGPEAGVELNLIAQLVDLVHWDPSTVTAEHKGGVIGL